MSLSALTVLALSVTLFVVLQEGFGLPVSGTSPASAQSSSRHVRTKRCSCNSWLDKECIYFCHLDIIWVNTPSKIIPYGLGSPLSRRRRRSPGRCACSSPVDTDCSGFCHQSLENPSKVVGPMEEAGSHSDTHSNNLLASLRSVIQSNNKAFPVLAAASWKRPSRVARHKIRYRRAGDRGAQRAQRAST